MMICITIHTQYLQYVLRRYYPFGYGNKLPRFDWIKTVYWFVIRNWFCAHRLLGSHTSRVHIGVMDVYWEKTSFGTIFDSSAHQLCQQIYDGGVCASESVKRLTAESTFSISHAKKKSMYCCWIMRERRLDFSCMSLRPLAELPTCSTWHTSSKHICTRALCVRKHFTVYSFRLFVSFSPLWPYIALAESLYARCAFALSFAKEIRMHTGAQAFMEYINPLINNSPYRSSPTFVAASVWKIFFLAVEFSGRAHCTGVYHSEH